MHKLYTRARPWCIPGDFNSALHLEDKVAGSSVIDISMREFKECIDEEELVDINRSGLQFTWNQKPRGLDGTLKKIDRIMANLGFMDLFVGAHAIFQPYRISDHSPAILTIPTSVTFKPRPFKFANILVQNPRFKEKVKEAWGMNVSGFFMYRVVSKLKLLKKPLRGLLFNEGLRFYKSAASPILIHHCASCWGKYFIGSKCTNASSFLLDIIKAPSLNWMVNTGSLNGKSSSGRRANEHSPKLVFMLIDV
ncbi:RNA-directed DNA polymerase, eukaryota, Reverse transcriptase zinc-binding domain protein [Artemisia annua]|uniref:RNA-directed DNA polymerase, eukaryota, Reverse transcriptase zinc-binding domain protein n=1 Tax=Artemisia annua TaxID=35608 RepID=A0A2U1Q782_ARTAN|nr:RNA-directed DNA polymerase, eukaryota, Reverse transcriptase zinc-binding domain protein [Artemisia annua]